MSSPISQPVITTTLDAQAGMSAPLQQRLDSWKTSPPKTPSEMRGPIYAWLQKYRFPDVHFLVNPRPLLRLEDLEPATKGGETNGGVDTADEGMFLDHKRSYPDLTVEQYAGTGLPHDTIRVIIEFGSPELGHLHAIQQLSCFMDEVDASRWRGELLGMAMVGTEVCFVRRTSDNGRDPEETEFVYEGEWLSLWDERVIQQFDRIRDLSLRQYP